MTVVHPGIIVASAMVNPNPPSADGPYKPANPSAPDCPEATLAAHDLRNLLAGVMGHAEIQRHLVADRSPAHQLDLVALERSLETIVQAAAHAQILCEEMLALSDGNPPQRIPVSLQDLVTHVVDLFTACSHGLELRVEGPDAVEVHGQRIDLERTLLNLLWNAREAVLDQAQACLELRWGENEEGPWVSVADNGPGLPEGHLGDLSQAFHSHKDSHGRLRGLGLHLVARVMRRHGGRLLARNWHDGEGKQEAANPSLGTKEKCTGAVFTLQFGFAPELDFDTPAVESPRAPQQPDSGGRR